MRRESLFTSRAARCQRSEILIIIIATRGKLRKKDSVDSSLLISSRGLISGYGIEFCTLEIALFAPGRSRELRFSGNFAKRFRRAR